MPLPPEVEFGGLIGPNAEVWSLGKVAVVMPRRRDDWPDELRDAWYRRLEANLTLHCECGGTFKTTAPGHGAMEHAYECPASDERIAELLEAAG